MHRGIHYGYDALVVTNGFPIPHKAIRCNGWLYSL
jgi:hypothetical protein